MSAPRVSIGMPAYNAQATLAESIESLLAQRFADFELIVSDNASSDETWAIVQDYAGRDARIVTMRQPRNIGANGNYSAVFRPARGEYFKWASANDWCGPDFVGRCVEHLDAHADTVLAMPRTRLFDGSLDNARDYDGDVALDADDAVDRFIETSRLRLNNVFNGVMRSAALRSTRLIGHYPGADYVLIGHLALLGKIVLLPHRDYYRRMEARFSTSMMSRQAVHRHHYPEPTLRALLPSWRKSAGWAAAALAAPLTTRQRLRALWWAARQGYWRKADLGHDLVDALRHPSKR